MASLTPASGATEPVDRARLAEVRDEFGEDTIQRFIAMYLELLKIRLKLIVEPVERGGTDGLRAASDLRVSSEMLGAVRLAEVAARFEQSFQAGETPGARQVALLRTEADVVATALAGLPRSVDENEGL
jgi:HPt (histidine-containing phosphotransfer) domain-containing protein